MNHKEVNKMQGGIKENDVDDREAYSMGTHEIDLSKYKTRKGP